MPLGVGNGASTDSMPAHDGHEDARFMAASLIEESTQDHSDPGQALDRLYSTRVSQVLLVSVVASRLAEPSIRSPRNRFAKAKGTLRARRQFET
jgi:hypothetical protein